MVVLAYLAKHIYLKLKENTAATGHVFHWLYSLLIFLWNDVKTQILKNNLIKFSPRFPLRQMAKYGIKG